MNSCLCVHLILEGRFCLLATVIECVPLSLSYPRVSSLSILANFYVFHIQINSKAIDREYFVYSMEIDYLFLDK